MYKINELASIAGISTRTLRYYDKIGLLSPSYKTDTGYRIYTSLEVDTLQSILFYKELGYELSAIKKIISSQDYDVISSLAQHKMHLQHKKDKLERLISLVDETIYNKERNIEMKDDKKFEAFKDLEIQKNRELYEDEMNEKYDKDFTNQSYKKYKQKSKWEFEQQEILTKKLNELIIEAVTIGNPHSSLAMEMCELHKQWLMFYWPSYNKEHHLALIETYTTDQRFTKYYDEIIEGGAVFLYEAMKYYIDK